MAALNIDRSVAFLLDDGIADDEAFRTSLGVDSYVRVHSEHMLAKYKDTLGINSAERNGGYVALSFAQIHFALMRAIDLGNIKDRNAVIILRPHTLGMALATLKGAGGLQLYKRPITYVRAYEYGAQLLAPCTYSAVIFLLCLPDVSSANRPYAQERTCYCTVAYYCIWCVCVGGCVW